MKNATLLSIMTGMFFCACVALAQTPQLTINNMCVFGDSSDFIDVDSTQAQSIQPGSGGANQTWNFPMFTAHDSDTYVYMDPAGTPYVSDFSSADLCAHHLKNNQYQYSQVSSSAYNLLGHELSVQKLIYTVPIKYFAFPVNYLDQRIGTAIGTLTQSGSTIKQTIYDTSNVDGYGTLVLQGKTYSKVLRTFLNRKEIDSVFIGSTYYATIVTTLNDYQWLDQDHKDLLLDINIVTSQNNLHTITYLKNPKQSTITNVMESRSFQNMVSVFPNPFSDVATIRINDQDLRGENIDLILYDLVGREMKHQQFIAGDNVFLLARNDLSEGMYFYKLTNSEGIVGQGKVMIK